MTDRALKMDEAYGILRHGIFEVLRRELQTRVHTRYLTVIPKTAIQSLLSGYSISSREEEDGRIDAIVCQIYHELYLERIIIPGTASLSASSPMDWPFFQITEHGRQVLHTLEYSPYDPDGYLRRLKSEILDVDETIVRYTEESLKCLKMECLLAATVTIGCASEQAMLLLIERFGQAIADPTRKQAYEKQQAGHWMITKKYQVLRQHLDSIVKSLPKDLALPLEQTLHGAFDLIRRSRNDAGHPTGEPVTRETVLAGHLLFPGYCKYVYSLMEHFAKHGVNL